ncbi:MAG: SAM-dependent methyltransferase [Planctomycetes bacterium]|nr:SAM-dependent methyltransferase [Planctomycetota bacterium]
MTHPRPASPDARALPVSPIERFLALVDASCAEDRFVELRLSSPRAGTAGPERVLVRLIRLGGAAQLSFTRRETRRDTTQNLPLAQGLAQIRGELGAPWRSAWLSTTSGDWQLQFDRRDRPRLVAHAAKTAQAPDRAHDAKKQHVLGAEANDWLLALGILDARGQTAPGMGSKRQQITRFVEVLHHLARDCGWDAAESAPETPLTVVEAGCGKGHLSFAAWHLLHRVLRRTTRVLGVELRPELVATANAAAVRLGAEGLSFVAGDIAEPDVLPAVLPRVDAWIALHACNTATDHAIRRGIECGATLIAVSPCCHQELRPQLGLPAPLEGVLRHGAMAERMAEWVTDGLRLLVLEWAGYRTKAIEFVGSDHTPRNLLLAGVRARAPFADPARRRAIDEFRAFYGITSQALDPLLAARDG